MRLLFPCAIFGARIYPLKKIKVLFLDIQIIILQTLGNRIRIDQDRGVASGQF